MQTSSPSNDLSAFDPAQPLSRETVESLQELGEALAQIHRRLVAEGYVIVDGKISKPEANSTINGKS